MKARGHMAELSGNALSYLHVAASAGLVVCLIMAGAFATLGFVTTGEQDRRQSLVEADRMARISALLQENDAVRADRGAVVDQPQITDEPGNAPPAELVGKADETIVSMFAAGEDAASGDDGTPLAQSRSLAELFASSGPLPDVPPEAAALLKAPLRHLTADEAASLTAALSSEAGGFTIEVLTAPENEARLYASQLAGALRGAGIDARGPITVLTTAQTDGVLVSADENDDGPSAATLTALQTAGLPARPVVPGTTAADILAPEGTDVRVYVGGLRSSSAADKPSEVTAERAEPTRVLEDA